MLRSPFRLVSLLIALVMVFALAACNQASPSATAAPTAAPDTGTTDDTGTDDTADTGDDAAEEPSTGAADLPFVTITHYATGDANPNGQLEMVQEEWNKLLKERLNCELIQQWISWTDYLTKYNLLLASGDSSIDLFETSSTWLELWQNADRGAWLALDDLIPEYAPRTWAEIPAETWDECRFKGQIVCFPEDGYTQYVNHGIMYRADWAIEAGMDAQINNFEEMETYLDWVKENKEGVWPIDADQGWSLRDTWIKKETTHITILGVNSVIQGDSLADPYTAVNAIETDAFLLFAQDMKRWGDKGYWREDALNNTASMADSYTAATTATRFHHVQTHRGLKYDMENIRYPGEAVQEIMLFCDLDGELIQDPINTHGGIAVYAYSEDPERSVMVYECIRQDQDMYQLFGSDRPGIEGIHWEIDDEGYLKRPDGWDIDANAFSTNFWGGRVDRFEYPRRDEWEGIYDMWARLDTFVVPNPYAQFAFDKAPVDAQLSNISSLIVEHERPICLGKAGDPVAAVEAYRAALKAAGIDEYMAEVQRQLDEYRIYKASM